VVPTLLILLASNTPATIPRPVMNTDSEATGKRPTEDLRTWFLRSSEKRLIGMRNNVRNASTVDDSHSRAPVVSQPNPVSALAPPPSPERASARLPLTFAAFFLIAGSVGLVMVHDASTATHVHSTGLLTGVLATVSLVATLAYLAILAALHALPTGYSPARHAVSDYAVGRYGPLFNVALYISSVGVLTLAFAVIRELGSPPLPARDLVFLLIIPLTRIGMTLFPTSLEGRRVTRTGLIHYGFAIAAFTLTYLAISGMTPALQALTTGQWVHTPLGWAAWIIGPALVLVVITMARPLRRVFGVFERAFLVTTNIWFALAAILLIDRLH
jgi:hypothetical protein